MATEYWGEALGYEQIAPTTAIGLTVPDGAGVVVLRSEAQNIRWRDDGTNPTTSVGQLMLAADTPLVYRGNLKALRFLEVTSGGKVNATYYGNNT